MKNSIQSQEEAAKKLIILKLIEKKLETELISGLRQINSLIFIQHSD